MEILVNEGAIHMRRTAKMLFAALISMFMLLVCAAAADTTTYPLDELGMDIRLPNKMIVFTRDLDDSDPNLSLFGLEKEAFLDSMISSGIYLNAVEADASAEIVVTMTENELSNFNLLSDAELTAIQDNLDSLYQDLGRIYLGSEVYQNHQATFIKISFTTPDSEMPINSSQYYTIYANKAINITLHSYNGAISTEQALMLQDIVDSAVFKTVSSTPEPSYTPSKAFHYYDEETYISFTVPANWTETPVVEGVEHVDMAFLPNTNSDAIITYSCEDIWPTLPLGTRLLLTRASLDNSYLTTEDAAEIFGVSPQEVSTVVYNDKEYFHASFMTEDAEPCLQMMHVENGCIYVFLFIGSTISRNYTDFERLLDSVVYMTPVLEYSFFDILFSILLTITVYTVPIVIYRYAIRKSKVEPKKARKITILYGIAAWIVMTIILLALGGTEAAGSAIIPWSLVNYRILAGSKAERKQVEAQAAIAAALEQEQVPCPHCGTFMPRHCSFCPQCGEKTPNRN